VGLYQERIMIFFFIGKQSGCNQFETELHICKKIKLSVQTEEISSFRMPQFSAVATAEPDQENRL